MARVTYSHALQASIKRALNVSIAKQVVAIVLRLSVMNKVFASQLRAPYAAKVSNL